MPYRMRNALGGPGTCQQNARRFSHSFRLCFQLSTLALRRQRRDRSIMAQRIGSEGTPLNALEDIDGTVVNKRFTASFRHRLKMSAAYLLSVGVSEPSRAMPVAASLARDWKVPVGDASIALSPTRKMTSKPALHLSSGPSARLAQQGGVAAA